jgi:hypothetical protein
MGNEAVAIRKVAPGVLYSIAEPRVRTLTSAEGAVTIFDRADGELRDIGRIEIQNLGTGAVLIAFNQDAQDNSFHKLLAGGSTDRDGLGSEYVVEPWLSVKSVSVKAVADTEIAVTLFRKEW